MFALGADVSWLPMMEATGFPFKNKNGEPQDCLLTLKDFGMNALRLRSWVNPTCHPFSGHCSTEETLAMGLRGQAMGFDIMVDFHYGDSWCDPGKQKKPAAWENLSFDALLGAVYDYTRSAMDIFIKGGLTPKWVQLGNETNPGILLPDGSTDDFSKLAAIFNAGHDAVKAVSPESLTMIHLAEGNKTDFCVNYFDRLAERQCRYDMIGLSYYPWWLKTTNESIINDLSLTMKTLPERYDKDIIIVEIGGEDEKEDESYELLASVLHRCADIPRCKGLFYWEPQGARVWSGYALSAWRSDGTPTRALDAYFNFTPE
jgi:arabinogalactan endo-1,4-beta-galactosidase